MLLQHLNQNEKVLLALSEVAKNSGNTNLRGGPREWFVREFLREHLPRTLTLGQGEIIDRNSEPTPSLRSQRPQVDVVVYRADLPRIHYGGNNTAFLIEGVLGTMEVKSELSKEGLMRCCEASTHHKSLEREDAETGLSASPKTHYAYVVAYDITANAGIPTVGNWLARIRDEWSEKEEFPAELLIDAVVVLGKGTLWRVDAFRHLPGFDMIDTGTWAYVTEEQGNLFRLFLHMLGWMSFLEAPPSALGYARNAFEAAIETID